METNYFPNKLHTPPLHKQFRGWVRACVRACVRWSKIKGAVRWGATGPRVSERKIFLREGLWEDLQKPLKGSFLWLSRHYQHTSRRFLEVLSETLPEEDFPLRDSRSCCPSSCCPLISLQVCVCVRACVRGTHCVCVCKGKVQTIHHLEGRRKVSRYGFLGFERVFESTTGLEITFWG